jgi:hypothetical protein
LMQSYRTVNSNIVNRGGFEPPRAKPMRILLV